MNELLSLLKQYKAQTVLAPAFKMIEAVLELCVPLVIASMIDDGIALSDMSHVGHCAVLLIVLAALGMGFSVTGQFFSAYVATEVSTSLREKIFAKVQQLSFAQLDEAGSSTLITRLSSDVNQVQAGVNLSLRLLLRSPFVVFGAMVMAFTIHMKIAGLFVLVIGLLALCIGIVMKYTLPQYENLQRHLDGLLMRTRQSLMGVRPIRAFGREQRMEEDFVAANDEMFMRQKKVGNIASIMNPLTFAIVNGGLAILLYFGGDQVNTGILSQGEMVALVNYISQILVELVKFANYLITVTKSIACAKRIEEVLRLEQMQQSGKKHQMDTDAMLTFDNLVFSYKEGANAALEGINLSIKKGEKIGVIGGTGAGKSTLAALAMGHYAATDGNVFWEQINILDLEPKMLRGNMAWAEQKPKLFKGTIRSNLRMGKRDATEEEMLEALKGAQAYEFVSELDKGLDALVEQDGSNFSGGQRQRLSIARALIRKPKLLVLDDCTSALDYATDAAFRHYVQQSMPQTTVIWNSQRISVMEHMNRVLLLKHGKMVALGTHEELLKRCEEYREISAAQGRKERSYEA
ncbi:ABC transporter ATP-binding protein [Eubacterium oxidoreducens]|uniref:ABC-type multidrug transport system, ATPase and permease component n=1 Tax=Eubacterium oxidoreducens TaxID=1732 RepID=A0A1G6BW56_EUBOX|nr:ABC transporter ATP-binding protein [Eubacterium oxidoreducens]SDB24861.1 ABC-type multidrug transport system, ATPase and permease component [Eubacterium oxidoreducens]